MKPYYLAVILFSLAGSVLATDYFVEKGGDDGNPGTRMQPFKSIQKAASIMQPGDVCTVSRGLYRETVRPARSGKPGYPLLFQAAPGESVSIGGADEGSGWQNFSGGVYRMKAERVIQVLADESPATRNPVVPLQSTGSSKATWYHDGVGGFVYVRLPRNESPESHHLELQTREWGVDAGGLAHIEVKGFNLMACGINLSGARMCRLSDCHLWWAGERSSLTNASPTVAAILMGGKDNELLNSSIIGNHGFGLVLMSEGANNSVVNCLFRGVDDPEGGAVGILAQGTAPLVRNVSVMNYAGGALVCRDVLNARIENNDLHHAGLGRTNTVLVQLSGDGKGTVLAYNWIHDNAAAGGMGIQFDGPVENYVVRQNVVWGQPGAAVSLSSPCRFNFIFNNTCSGNGAGIDVGPAGSATDVRETRIINNILVGPVWASCGGTPPEKLVWKSNFTGPTPGFVDEVNRNFSLVAGSPCIDAGQEEPEFTDEFTGKLPDIGACEFGKDPVTPGCHVNENANKVVTPLVKLVMDSETDGSEVHYTLDGRTPDLSSPVYTGAVPVVYGAVVKMKAFRAGMEESGSSGFQLRRIE